MADGINSSMYEFGAGKSAIRVLFEKSMALQQQGVTDIWDFSIGDPYVPAPDAVQEAIEDTLATMTSHEIHGYTANNGLPSVRRAIARNLNKRFGHESRRYDEDDLILTAGAAGAISATIAAITNAGEDVIVLAPYFPEYRMYIQAWHCHCVAVDTRPVTFQPDVEAIERAICPTTRAVIIDTPNNPTGAVYTSEVLEELADMLRQKEKELDRTIYLISDEPYREIVYDGHENPWVPDFYEDTIVCYSYSKSLSLPGERAGYILVPPTVTNHDRLYDALLGGQRAINTIMGSLVQRVIERCAGIPAPIEEYRRKRHIIYHGLTDIGYDVVRPDGAFYLWIRALEQDEQAFSDKAFEHGLLLVPSDDFGSYSYVRLSYCCDDETLSSSLPAFQALWDDYGGYRW